MRRDDQLETRTQAIGRQLWAATKAARPGLFDTAFWQGQAMEWVMRDPSFRVDLFRFVDVLPTLDDNAALRAHIQEYLLREERELPTMLAASLKAGANRFTGGLAGGVIRRQVRGMAEQFILGEDPAAALKKLRALRQADLAFTADLLGELVLSRAESAVFAERYRDLIDGLADECSGWTDHPVLDHDDRGPLPRAQVSLKVSAFDPHLDATDPAGGVARLSAALLPLLQHARSRGVGVTLDMEHWELHGITLDLAEALARHPTLADWPHFGVAIQAYTHAAPADLARLLKVARERGAPLNVRLVKGAYWDVETALAQQRSLPCPVLATKAATDAQFEALTDYLLDHIAQLRPAFASHNLRSLAHALAAAEARAVPLPALEVQMLYGMAEPLRDALAARGVRVRLYTPLGELLPGMAYLVRRLLENTANSGFIRQSVHDAVPIETLLAAPSPTAAPVPSPFATPPRPPADATSSGDPLATPFTTCPPTDFTDAAARDAFAAAVAALADTPPIRVPVVVDGEPVADLATLSRSTPNAVSRPLATVHLADAATVERAVASAYAAWPAWRDRPLRERAARLETLADRLQADRQALAALQVHEVAKPWREADADVAEAIDFCRYYARQALRELAPQQVDLPGEANTWLQDGHGPCAVIAPWNFPLAILTGMAAAALVAGCPVLLKPAEQSSATAHALHRHLLAAGFPPATVQFLPGLGEEVGAQLVAHPQIAVVAFTGSLAVGRQILRTAAELPDGQAQVKHVVCEMGGKNAILVDADADLDEAVAGTIAAAFGYAGQKCSAASRVFPVGSAADAFVQRLVAAVRDLPLGPATDPGCRLPPVVDAEAHARLMALHRDPGPGTTVLYRGALPSVSTSSASAPAATADTWLVPPLILQVDRPDHPLMQRELFGPVLCVYPVADFASALQHATASPFALTGAVYSRQPNHLDAARRAFRVGNLYLNRGSTGALVGRQPFGGFGHSGTGGKAGGPGYLRQFTAGRCITENTLRRGILPDASA